MGDIFRAIADDNEEVVRRLLDSDPGLVERVDYDGSRPLVLAAWRGRLGVVTLLIERGANINATGAWGCTALHTAAEQGNEEVVALLLDKGAQANSRDQRGRTPLMPACCWGHLGLVKMLVQHIGHPGLDEKELLDGWTALHYAARDGRVEVVRCLLLAGADPTITDDEGRTPRALAKGNDQIQRRRRTRARCVAVFQVSPLKFPARLMNGSPMHRRQHDHPQPPQQGSINHPHMLT
jgi:ankyrin repeat protein